MIPPYPPPLNILNPVYLAKDQDPESAVDLLVRKIDEITRLLHEYMRYQDSLAEYICQLQETHEKEYRATHKNLRDAQVQMKGLESSLRALQRSTDTSKSKELAQMGTRTSGVSDGQTFRYNEGLSLKSPRPPLFASNIQSETPSQKSSPGMLSLQLQKATNSLRDLLGFVYSDHELAAPHREDLDCKITGRRYGCFKTLAANCYVVRQWQIEESEHMKQLWDIRANIVETRMSATKLSKAISSSERGEESATQDNGGPSCRNELPARSAVNGYATDSESPPQDLDIPSLQDADAWGEDSLLNLNSSGHVIDGADVDAARTTYAFSLSLSLPESKQLEELTKEDAIQILSALPLTVSFCLDSDKDTDASSPPVPANGVSDFEGGSVHMLLRKSLHSGEWSVDDAPEPPAAGISASSVSRDQERPTPANGQSILRHRRPVTYQPGISAVYSTPGGSPAYAPPAAGPSSTQKAEPSTKPEAQEKTVKLTAHRTTTDGDSSAQKGTESLANERLTRSRRKRIEDSEPPAATLPTRRTTRRRGKAAAADDKPEEAEEEPNPPRKRRKLGSKK